MKEIGAPRSRILTSADRRFPMGGVLAGSELPPIRPFSTFEVIDEED
jgi:hypothetical protein